MQFDWKIALADWLQFAALIATALIFYFQRKQSDKDRAEAEKKAHEDRKVQIYQTLEMESNSIFRFETEHKYVTSLLKTQLAPPDFRTVEIADRDGTVVTERERYLVGRKYYEITCNIFEVSARLRKLEIADYEVFGSWVAWYFDALTEWGFRAAWDGLRDNYTRDLRKIFDPFVAELIKTWDVPHHQDPAAVATLPSAEALEVDLAKFEDVRARFYQHVASLYGKQKPDAYDLKVAEEAARNPDYAQCFYVRDWLHLAQEGRPMPHPMAYG